MRDMATMLKEQKGLIMEYEEKILSMKAENDALQSKNMLGIPVN